MLFRSVTPYGGYRDDEDQGQMGALGVLMAMGLFEVDGGCAVKPYYEITSPIFDKVTIHLDNRYYPGKTFQIVTTGNSDKNMYIQRATFDGKPWDRCWFYHEDFANNIMDYFKHGNSGSGCVFYCPGTEYAGT